MTQGLVNVEQDMHCLLLRQMGAKVEVIRGVVCYVKFRIGDTEVKYAYNINKKGRYFLQRRAPYPLPVGTFESEEDIINIIRHDIAQFENAKNSTMFGKFIQASQDIHTLLRQFDDLYLYYNIPATQFEKFENIVEDLQNLTIETKNMSERVYFDKEPDSLK